MVRINCKLAFCLTIYAAIQCLYGQGERASVTGTVMDVSKAVIAEAEVSIRNVATNVVTRTTTNTDGLYYIPSLPPGTYELSVSKGGFRTSRIASIPLTTALTATVD